jgi:hypothetical protein
MKARWPGTWSRFTMLLAIAQAAGQDQVELEVNHAQ